MLNYMPKVGSLGLDMMLRTCTIQVNLDYASEADMARKFRVGLALQPLATALFANSPFTEGRPNGFLSFRSHIWSDTDPRPHRHAALRVRGRLRLRALSRLRARRADVLRLPRRPLYRRRRPVLPRFPRRASCPALPGEKPRLSDWTDHLSTIFPEVRLKSFLEMRGADGGRWSKICALPALWVGLLYDQAALDAAWDEVKDWTPRGAPARCATRCRSSASPRRTPGGETLRELGKRDPRHRRGRPQRPRPAQRRRRQRIRLPRSAARGRRLAARPRPSGCSNAIMANGQGDISPHLRGDELLMPERSNPPDRRTLYPPIEPYRDRPARRRRRPQPLLGALRHAGRQAGRLPPRRPRRRLQPRPSPPVRSRRATTSSCSTSAAAAARPRMPRWRPTPPGIWSTTSSGCASMAGRRALDGLRRLLGLDPRPRLCPDPSRARHRAGAARHLHLPPDRARLALPLRRLGGLSRTNGRSSSRRSPRRSAATSSPPINAG